MGKRATLFDPTTAPKERPFHYAPRPDSLKGKKVGLVDNTKFNSDKLLQKIGEVLKQQYGVDGTIIRRKKSPSSYVHEEILNELSKECHAVVAGIGD